MAHLIDKSVVVAEIERRINFQNKDRDFNYLQIKELEALLCFLDTLEVKKEATTTDAFIKKACDWLIKHAKKYYFNKERYLGTDELVEDFKLSMEI